MNRQTNGKYKKQGCVSGVVAKLKMYCTLWQSHEQTVITTKADNNNNGINRETDVGDVSFLIEDRDRVKSVVAVGFLQETSKLWSSR